MNILRYQRTAALAGYHVLCHEGAVWVSRLFAAALPDAFDYHVDYKRELELGMLRNFEPEADRGKRLKFRIKIKKQYNFTQFGPGASYIGDLEETDDYVDIVENLFWDTGTGQVDTDIYRRTWLNPEHSSFVDSFLRHETGTLNFGDLLIQRAVAISQLKVIIRDQRVECELVKPNWKSTATVETRSADAVAPTTTDRGEWGPEEEYSLNDKVTQGAKSYYSLVRSKGRSPSDKFYWSTKAPEAFRLTDKRSQIISGQKMLDQLYLFADGTGCHGAFGNTTEHDWRIRFGHSMPSALFATRFDTGDGNIPFIGAGATTGHFSGGFFFTTAIIENGNFQGGYQFNISGYDISQDSGTGLVPVNNVASGGSGVTSGGQPVTTS